MPMDGGFGRVAGISLAVTVVGLASASIAVGSVPLVQCIWLTLLDVWLLVQGVTALGAFLGVIIWRHSVACGKALDGPKIILGVLLAINVAWLVLGNVVVGIVYNTCSINNFDTIFYLDSVDCSTYILPFTLAVVVIFDFIYIILLLALCLNYGNCFVKDTETTMTFNTTWVWWTLVTLAAGYFLLGVLSIGVGASYLQPCQDQEWVPIWLVVHGVIVVVTVMVLTCWLRLKIRLRDSWVQPTMMLILPFVFLAFITLISTAISIVWVVQEREQNCTSSAVCNPTLQVLAIVIIALITTPVLVLIYVAVIFFILFKIFLLSTSCQYFSEGGNTIEDMPSQEKL